MLQKNTRGFLYRLRVLRYRRRFLHLNGSHADKMTGNHWNQKLLKKKTKQRNRKKGSALCSMFGAFAFLSVLFLATVGIVACLMPEVRIIIVEFMKNQLCLLIKKGEIGFGTDY